MGCTPSKTQLPLPPSPISTPCGVLKLTFESALIVHEASIFKMNPYLKIKMGIQNYMSKVVVKGGKNPIFMETHEFFINSIVQQNNRKLELTLMDQSKLGDNLIGSGVINVNELLIPYPQKIEFKVEKSKIHAGTVKISSVFMQEVPETVFMKVEQARVLKVSPFSNSYSLQITLGEEQVETSSAKQTDEKLPNWATEIFTFKLIPSIKICVIKVFCEKEEIGKAVIQTQRIRNNLTTNEDDDGVFVEDFHDEDGNKAGELKISLMLETPPTQPKELPKPSQVQNPPKNPSKPPKKIFKSKPLPELSENKSHPQIISHIETESKIQKNNPPNIDTIKITKINTHSLSNLNVGESIETMENPYAPNYFDL